MSDSDHPFVKFIRLQNGDDLVTEVVEVENEDGIIYTLINPLKVTYLQSERDGYMSVSFMPWVFPRICTLSEFSIHESDVMIISDVTEGMNNYYWENIDTYMYRSKQDKNVNPDTGMTKEEELELYKRVMEHIGTKRTMH